MCNVTADTRDDLFVQVARFFVLFLLVLVNSVDCILRLTDNTCEKYNDDNKCQGSLILFVLDAFSLLELLADTHHQSIINVVNQFPLEKNLFLILRVLHFSDFSFHVGNRKGNFEK